MTTHGIPRGDSFSRSGSNQSVFHSVNEKIEEEKNEELSRLDEGYQSDCAKLLQKYPLVNLNSDVFKEVTFYNKDFEVLKSSFDKECVLVEKKYIEKTKNFRTQAIASRKSEIALMKVTSQSALPSTTSDSTVTTQPISTETGQAATNQSVLPSTASESTVANQPISAETVPIEVKEPASSSMDLLATASKLTIYITARYDTKFPNLLSICGEGPNMSWEMAKAIPLRCVGTDKWVYETSSHFERFEYKLIFNNKVWEKGKNHFVDRENPVEITPIFIL